MGNCKKCGNGNCECPRGETQAVTHLPFGVLVAKRAGPATFAGWRCTLEEARELAEAETTALGVGALAWVLEERATCRNQMVSVTKPVWTPRPVSLE